jgi:hypothetical protein
LDAGFINLDVAVRAHREELDAEVSSLRGQLLVADEEVRTCKSKLSDQRKGDNDRRRERSQFEAAIEAKTQELAAAQAELVATRQRADDARATASEQVAQLLDKNVDAGKEIQTLKAECARLASLLEVAVEQRALKEFKETALDAELKQTKTVARWLVGLHVRKHSPATRAATHTPTCEAETMTESEDCGTTERESPSPCTSSAPSSSPTHEDLLNMVASAKGLVAHLNSFVDKVQSNSSESKSSSPEPHKPRQSRVPHESMGTGWMPYPQPPHDPYYATTYYNHHGNAHDPENHNVLYQMPPSPVSPPHAAVHYHHGANAQPHPPHPPHPSPYPHHHQHPSAHAHAPAPASHGYKNQHHPRARVKK